MQMLLTEYACSLTEQQQKKKRKHKSKHNILEMEEEQPLIAGITILKESCANARQVFRIAQNLKLLIDKIIPTVFEEKDITSSHSPILNSKVIELAYAAAGGKGDGKEGTSSYKYRAALIFALLKVTDWYWQQADYELYDNELYSLRAVAAQALAAAIIECIGVGS